MTTDEERESAWVVAGEHPADRLMRAQDVQRGSLQGDGPPTPLQVAAVMHGLADHTHILHMLVVADRCLLVRPSEESPWPGALSLGRYFHGIADNLEMANDPRQPAGTRARVEAMLRWLIEDGHLTPMGQRQIQRVLDQELGRG